MYKYPSLRNAVVGYMAGRDTGSAASDQFVADGGQDGTLTNGATRVNDGGLAYSFDGVNDYILTTLSPAAIGNAFTVAAWVKPPNINTFGLPITTRPSAVNVSTDRFFGIAYGNFINGASNKKISFGLLQTVSNYRSWITNADVIDGNWHHIAVVVETSSVTIYVDGFAVTATLSSVGAWPSISSGRGTLSIGAANDGTIPAAGPVDDVIVFPRQLTAAEIGYLASARGAAYQQTGTRRRRSSMGAGIL